MTGTELLESMKELVRLDILYTVGQSPSVHRRMGMHLHRVTGADVGLTPEVMSAVAEDFQRWCRDTMLSG